MKCKKTTSQSKKVIIKGEETNFKNNVGKVYGQWKVMSFNRFYVRPTKNAKRVVMWNVTNMVTGEKIECANDTLHHLVMKNIHNLDIVS